MSRYPPTRPGWYRNPDDPRSLRYWDGKGWAGRPRSRPAWAKRDQPFELEEDEADRSVEGPVHPDELREPVASGAWARDLFGPWRPRQAEGWRRGGAHPSRPMVPPRPQAPVRLGPARRPLVLLVALVMVAAAVVVSSVAVLSPYEIRNKDYVLEQAQANFTVQASRACSAAMPTYRAQLANSVDGPTISAVAAKMDLLRQRLAQLPTNGVSEALVMEWLQAWEGYTSDETRYASLIGPAARVHGRAVLRRLSERARLEANLARRKATEEADRADHVGANMGLGACRIG